MAASDEKSPASEESEVLLDFVLCISQLKMHICCYLADETVVCRVAVLSFYGIEIVDSIVVHTRRR